MQVRLRDGDQWNYLRVRGEYLPPVMSLTVWGELPPRARRIRGQEWFLALFEGTTSACAENTLKKFGLVPRNGNYLRVRGEYFWREELTAHTMELPPRARRIQALGLLDLPDSRNYLRVRGEYTKRVTQAKVN